MMQRVTDDFLTLIRAGVFSVLIGVLVPIAWLLHEANAIAIVQFETLGILSLDPPKVALALLLAVVLLVVVISVLAHVKARFFIMGTTLSGSGAGTMVMDVLNVQIGPYDSPWIVIEKQATADWRVGLAFLVVALILFWIDHHRRPPE